MLAMEGRYGDAGRLLVAQLQLQPGEAARLDPEERKLVSVAATYLEKAGDVQEATKLFEALGNEERAALSRSRPSLMNPEDAVASSPTVMSLDPPPSSVMVDPHAATGLEQARPKNGRVEHAIADLSIEDEAVFGA